MTTTPTDLDLVALDALRSAATPLPWFWDSYSTVHSAPISREYDRLEALIPDDAAADDPRWDALPVSKVCGVPRRAGDTPTAQGAKDAEFIVAACNAAPALVARVTALESALREALDEFEDALGYVDRYHAAKWKYRETLARLREVAGAPPRGEDKQ